MKENRVNIFNRALSILIFMVWGLVLLISLESDVSSLSNRNVDDNQNQGQRFDTPHNRPLYSVTTISFNLSFAQLLDFYYSTIDCSDTYKAVQNIHNQTVQVHLKLFDKNLSLQHNFILKQYTARSHLSDGPAPLFS